MARLSPYFPRSHGKLRVDDRCVVSEIIFVDRNGLRWRDAPREYGSHKALYNRWRRWGEKWPDVTEPRYRPIEKRASLTEP